MTLSLTPAAAAREKAETETHGMSKGGCVPVHMLCDARYCLHMIVYGATSPRNRKL